MAADELVLNVKSDIGDVTKDTEKLTKESKKASTGVGGIGKAFKGMGTAIKAAGIGLVVALLAKLMEVFSKNQKVLDVFNTAMTALSIAFNDLFGFISNNIGTVTGYFKELFEDPSAKIKELGTAIKDGLVVRFNEFLEVLGLVGKAFGQLIDGEFSKAFDTIKEAGVQVVDVYTGVDDSLEKITETIVKYTTETLKQAEATTNAAKSATFAQAEFAKLNAQFLKDAELQRQIRDDETKTFAERIEANNKLNEVLEEQQKLQREQVQIQITAAALLVKQNASDENKLALMEANNAMLELEETITGQLSEQKTNAVALEKELLETQKEVRAEGLLGLELELQELQDAYDLKLEMARKSGMDTTAITKKFEAQKTQIVKSNENLKLAAISGFADSVNKIAGEQKAIAVATALMNTYLGVTEVMKDPTIPSTTMKFLAAGTVLAGGLANVQNILKQDVGSGSGGGGGNVAGSTAPAPQMMSGAFDISGGVAPEAMKAFVVTDEMSNSQNQLANIRRRATI
jgi:hypothetical protein